MWARKRRTPIDPSNEHELNRLERVVFYLDDEAWADPNLRRLPDYFQQFYTSMITQDVGSAMAPLRGAYIGLQPRDEVNEQILALAISRRQYNSDLGFAAHEFFDLCARRVMAYGEAVYVILNPVEAEGDRPAQFTLAHIDPATLLRDTNGLGQYVPKSLRREFDGRERIDLPAKYTLAFRAPQNLRFPIRRTMEALASIGHSSMPDWAMYELGDPQRRTKFDAEAHRRAHQLALAHACKDLGWNARDLIRENMLEFYLLHRMLRFEKFKAELREQLLKTLNDGLGQLDEEIGFTGQLTIEGVPSLSDVQTAEAHLASGSLNFHDLMEPFISY